IVLSCRLRIALHEISVPGFLSLERTLTEKVVHKCSDVESDLRVQRFVVRFKHNPLQTAIETLFDEESETADRDVFVFTREPVVAIHRSRSPVDDAVWKDSDRIDSAGIQDPVLVIREFPL